MEPGAFVPERVPYGPEMGGEEAWGAPCVQRGPVVPQRGVADPHGHHLVHPRQPLALPGNNVAAYDLVVVEARCNRVGAGCRPVARVREAAPARGAQGEARAPTSPRKGPSL